MQCPIGMMHTVYKNRHWLEYLCRISEHLWSGLGLRENGWLPRANLLCFERGNPPCPKGLGQVELCGLWSHWIAVGCPPSVWRHIGAQLHQLPAEGGSLFIERSKLLEPKWIWIGPSMCHVEGKGVIALVNKTIIPLGEVLWSILPEEWSKKGRV